MLGERNGAAAMGEVERSPQRLACRGSLLPAAERRAEVGESSSELEVGGGALKDIHPLAEKFDTLVAARDKAGGSQGDAQRSRRAKPSCQGEFFVGQPPGLVALPEGCACKGSRRAPRDDPRIRRLPTRLSLTARSQVLQPLPRVVENR